MSTNTPYITLWETPTQTYGERHTDIEAALTWLSDMHYEIEDEKGKARLYQADEIFVAQHITYTPDF